MRRSTTTLLVLFAVSSWGAGSALALDDGTLSFKDAEVRLGDRLFFETRFSQFFFANSEGDANATLAAGDPVTEKVLVAEGEDLPGPFAGQGINCRQCHLGSDYLPGRLRAGRTYGDFSRRSPIPDRGDGLTVTPRNSPIMIDLGKPRSIPLLLHLDGEFATHEDLIIETMTGRNFGWQPDEVETAKKHIVKVIREDEGVNPRHIREPDGKGIPYRVVLKGTEPKLQHQQIPPEYRIDVETASDDEILMAAAKLIHAYMDSLRFGTENTFRESGAPYDLFLSKNALPAEPDSGESDLQYARRLRGMIEKRSHFDWVTPQDDYFMLHQQPFEFGPEELKGLKIFLAEPQPGGEEAPPHVGNCVACHPPPRFTDFNLHNNGISQAEYDEVFGEGAFAALEIPGLEARNANFDAYLPASPKHPKAKGAFRAIPSKGSPGRADLGVWNVYRNPDMPKPQKALDEILCGPSGPARDCRPEAVLPLTIGYFKTPSVRDLGQSDPYFHTGATDTVEDALRYYVSASEKARGGKLRNGSPEIAEIRIGADDVAPLAAFLRSLNEDYH